MVRLPAFLGRSRRSRPQRRRAGRALHLPHISQARRGDLGLGHAWQTRSLAANRPDVRAFLRKFGASPIGRETPVKKTPAQLDDIHRKLLESMDRKRDLICALMKHFEWDVFITTFAEVHRGGHTVLRRGRYARRFAGNALVGDLSQARPSPHDILESLDLERTTLVFFSVHGMMRDYGQNHLVKPLMDRLNRCF